MAALLSLITIVAVSMIGIRTAAVALSLTGLSDELSKFQAVSAFSGVGYTTQEAEKIVNHPGRRRIVQAVMILGNVGVVTSISTLVLTFFNVADPATRWMRLAILVGSLGALTLFSLSGKMEALLVPIIRRLLQRYTDIDTFDYAALLSFSEGYAVAEIGVQEGTWLAKQTLAESDIGEENILVLGIERNGDYIGAPRGDTKILPDDLLILYGPEDTIASINTRPAGEKGEMDHKQTVFETERED